MPLPSTLTPIATNTLTAAAASVTFSNLPQGYTDLIVITNTTAAVAKDLGCRINSDSGTNYSLTHLSGTGSAAISGRFANQTYLELDNYGYIETTQGQMAISHFMNYANTTTFKTVLSRSANSANGTSAVVGLWRSTSAINSITFYAGSVGTNFNSGSSFTIYGVKAA